MKHIRNLSAIFIVLAFVSYLFLIFINNEPTMEQKQKAVAIFASIYVAACLCYTIYQDNQQ